VGNSVKGNGGLTGDRFFESCWAALNVFIRRGSGWGCEIKRYFSGELKIGPISPTR
jgi:hypothetical protein